MNKLNVGCGPDYKDGWINLDMGNCRCDVSHDIEITPWPFEDDHFDEVLMQHVLEHINRDNFITVIREMYRVCKNDAVVQIVSPYAGSDNFWTDPTHTMPLTSRTFDYFDEEKPLHELGIIYGWDDVRLRVEGRSIPNHPNGPDVGYNIIVIKD